MTYQTQPSILKVNLYGAGNFGSSDQEISMNYSIDNVFKGAVYLKSNGEMHFIPNAIGTAALPRVAFRFALPKDLLVWLESKAI